MKMMKMQEALNQVMRHAYKQNAVSTDSDGYSCQYRGEFGNKCFIEALIPDEIYLPKMEQATIGMLIAEYPAIKNLFKGISIGFLSRMQCMHDIDEIHLWEGQFSEVAKMYGLEIQVNNPNENG